MKQKNTAFGIDLEYALTVFSEALHAKNNDNRRIQAENRAMGNFAKMTRRIEKEYVDDEIILNRLHRLCHLDEVYCLSTPASSLMGLPVKIVEMDTDSAYMVGNSACIVGTALDSIRAGNVVKINWHPAKTAEEIKQEKLKRKRSARRNKQLCDALYFAVTS